MGHAEAELSEFRGARRLDLVIFEREDSQLPLVTGELKVPWDILGRTPYNTRVVEDALNKAVNAGAEYFVTWNIKRVVVWKTDQVGVPLSDRVVYDREIVSQDLRNADDFNLPEVQAALRTGVSDLISFLTSILAGLHTTRFLPVDLIFIARLEAALDHPIFAGIRSLVERAQSDRRFKLQVEGWMRDVQGWVLTPALESENFRRAIRFTCYVLVNKLCFYNALRRKYGNLPRLTVSNGVNTGPALERRLRSAFADARRFTGDYESVFEGDFGDSLPFLSDGAVADWREIVRMLDNYDFAAIDVDVIGSMYERLITPSERHRYGQHYTQPTVVDLMTSLTIEEATDTILDPGCGGGTFLVGAYKKKKHLNPVLEHSEVIGDLYGCDVLHYACHLTTINLAIRDLIDDDNFPRVHLGDFLSYMPDEVFSRQPIRVQAGGLPTGVQETRLSSESVDVVIGNPPYINAKELPAVAKSRYFADVQRLWPTISWKKSSDIYVYFFAHAARFLRNGGRLALLTQSGWLDGEFGVALQNWILQNFTLEMVIESEAEPWFTDARVATAITILRRTQNAAENHESKFIQFKRPLGEIYATILQAGADELARLLRTTETTNDFVRTRSVRQSQLRQDGVGDSGGYRGSRWGRHLRSPEQFYRFGTIYGELLCNVSDLLEVRRGVTTNCDDFFIVEDISKETLNRIPLVSAFRDLYGVPRTRVENRSTKIIRRSDGVEFALPADNLQPILKSARDLNSFSTLGLESLLFVVRIDGARATLSPLVEKYVAAGEREGWHQTPSFAANAGTWYSLRAATTAPILFPKTSQYVPLVLWNDAEILANQRLYEMVPKVHVPTLCIWAALNSSIFAFERYTAAKSLGREAAIDIEVFTANSLKLPDLRLFPTSLLDSINTAALTLLTESPTPALDDVLMQSGKLASTQHLAATPAVEANWPLFFSSAARRDIDLALLEGLGLSAGAALDLRATLCNEMLSYTRNLKMLEFDAQANRRNATTGTRVPLRAIAGELLQQLISDEQLTLRRIPEDFLPEGAETADMHIPAAGTLRLDPPDLFSATVTGSIKSNRLVFRNTEQAQLVGLLAKLGLVGTFPLPSEAESCSLATQAIEEYLDDFEAEVEHAAAGISADLEIQQRIRRESVGYLIHRT